MASADFSQFVVTMARLPAAHCCHRDKEEEVEDVAGGFDWPSIPDPYSDPAPDFYAEGRPLPFPQGRKGNKVPVEAPNKIPLIGKEVKPDNITKIPF